MLPTRFRFVATPGDSSVVVTSELDAPRNRVFETWTRPFDLERWWGPGSQRLVLCEVDLRVGGSFRYVLRSRTEEFSYRGLFRDIVRPSRLVQTFVDVARPENESLVTVQFDELGAERARVTETRLYREVLARDADVASGLEARARESLERLAEHLQQPATL